MLNKNQVFILLTIIPLFYFIIYFSWENKTSINSTLNNWKEQIIKSDKEQILSENESVVTTNLKVGSDGVEYDVEEIKITETDQKRLEVVNGYDNYSFILPEEWKEVVSSSYFEAQLIEQYIINTTIVIGGSPDQQISISKYENKISETKSIKDWINKMFDDVHMAKASVVDFGINHNIDAVIRGENTWVYFKDGFTVYAINYLDKEAVKEIILNGSW